MQQIKIMMNYLTKECYFTVDKLVIFQCILIPMGSVPARFLEHLYQYDYEAGFICSLVQTNKPIAVEFKNVSRFINDECNLNDSSEFSKSFHVIYLNQL